MVEMKNTFDGLFSRLDPAEEKVSALENISIGASKPGKEKKKQQQTKTSKQTQYNQQHYHQLSSGLPTNEFSNFQNFGKKVVLNIYNGKESYSVCKSSRRWVLLKLNTEMQ